MEKLKLPTSSMKRGNTSFWLNFKGFVDNDTIPDSSVLCCAGCKLPNLHFMRIEVFAREYDGRNGQHVTVGENGTIIDKDMSDNPSGRRDALSKWYWCEHCPVLTRIDEVQHKGNIYIYIKEDGYDKERAKLLYAECLNAQEQASVIDEWGEFDE